ncbi:unnamed protein product, partial [Meganyctiphanes norvegica]
LTISLHLDLVYTLYQHSHSQIMFTNMKTVVTLLSVVGMAHCAVLRVANNVVLSAPDTSVALGAAPANTMRLQVISSKAVQEPIVNSKASPVVIPTPLSPVVQINVPVLKA